MSNNEHVAELRRFSKYSCDNVEFGAVRDCANLVELENAAKLIPTHKKTASIQSRTSHPHFVKLCQLLTKTTLTNLSKRGPPERDGAELVQLVPPRGAVAFCQA